MVKQVLEKHIHFLTNYQHGEKSLQLKVVVQHQLLLHSTHFLHNSSRASDHHRSQIINDPDLEIPYLVDQKATTRFIQSECTLAHTPWTSLNLLFVRMLFFLFSYRYHSTLSCRDIRESRLRSRLWVPCLHVIYPDLHGAGVKKNSQMLANFHKCVLHDVNSS